MKAVDIQEAEKRIDKYLASNDTAFPFFVSVDGAEYVELRNKLRRRLEVIRVSDFCRTEDSFPDYDRLLDRIKDCKSPSLLLGLGEAIKYSGQNRIAGQLQDKHAGEKVVILCRGAYKWLNSMAQGDGKFALLQYIHVKSDCGLSVVQFMADIEEPSAVKGFKTMLSDFENKDEECMIVRSDLDLSSCTVIRTEYDAIKFGSPSFPIPEECLSSEQWREYSLDKECRGYPFDHWRTYLSCLLNPSDNAYQKFVVDHSSNSDQYSRNVLYALLQLNPSDHNFQDYYKSRKELLKHMEENKMAGYVLETAKKESDRIYYLTDSTLVERHAILRAIGSSGVVPDALSWIYPALQDYLCEYAFNCQNGQEISSYFSEYKHMKVCNQITEDFSRRVQRLSEPDKRIYNSLFTRGRLLEEFDQNKDYLYWLDALGVEYLGYIQKRAQSLGLAVNIKVGRSDLPTLTSCNSEFYTSWSGYKNSSKALDEIKHEGTKVPSDAEYPVHLADELSVIDNVLEEIATMLKGRQVSRVVLTSDHGASRLVVVNGQENKLRMNSKGEHSGRCCPCNDIDVKPDCATEENGYWVLANYERFQGGRKAAVEVHGGASLEEVLVPVIAVTLPGKVIEVENLSPVVSADKFKQVPELKLYCSDSVEKLQLRFNNKTYDSRKDPFHDSQYIVTLTDFRQSGQYNADVYANDCYVCTISFEIRHRGMQTKKSQDDFFK